MDFKNISQLISSLLLNWHSCYLKEKEGDCLKLSQVENQYSFTLLTLILFVI